MANQGEVEVFRLDPEVGKCYKHAEYSRTTGRYRNRRYFFKGEPKYVGRLLGTVRGLGSFFSDNGIINRVDYSSEGKTSFIAVPCEEPSEENSAKKTAFLANLKAMPPMGIFPGGKNYHNAKANFESKGGRRRTLRRRRV